MAVAELRVPAADGSSLPATAAAFEYFPARVLGLGENVPEHVMREWSASCSSPHYNTGPPGGSRPAGFARVTAPIRTYSFSDDCAPRRSVDALLASYLERTLRSSTHEVVRCRPTAARGFRVLSRGRYERALDGDCGWLADD